MDRTAFLHFHVQDGRRWADVRCGTAWREFVDVPFGLSRRGQQAVARLVARCQRETAAAG